MSISSSLLAVVLMTAGGDLREDCGNIDATAIHTGVRRVLSARGPDGIADTLAELENNWARVCIERRKAASPALVADLARLLKIRTVRATAVEMLFDIGDNLATARKLLADAIRDQARLDRWYYKRAYPVEPSSGTWLSDSLRCVMHKLETGDVDADLCIFLTMTALPR